MTTPLGNQEQNSQHPRSVETLGVSGDGDATIIPSVYEWCMNNGITLENEQAVSLSRLILSETHRIGNLAIGENDKHGITDLALCISDAINQEKFRQRQKLSTLTGVKENE